LISFANSSTVEENCENYHADNANNEDGEVELLGYLVVGGGDVLED